jgi:hypothetical protein
LFLPFEEGQGLPGSCECSGSVAYGLACQGAGQPQVTVSQEELGAGCDAQPLDESSLRTLGVFSAGKEESAAAW